MNILKKLDWWLFTPTWYKLWVKEFNTKLDYMESDTTRLREFCEMMDKTIGDSNTVTIYGNRKFMADYRLIFGAQASLMLYDGYPIVYRNQQEYFVLDTTKNL